MTINPLYHLFFPKSREVSQAKLDELKKKAEELKKEKAKAQKAIDDARKVIAASRAQMATNRNLYLATEERRKAAAKRIYELNEQKYLTEQRKKDEALARAKRIVEYNEKVYKEELAKQGLASQRKTINTNDYKTFTEAWSEVEKYNSPDYGSVYVGLASGYQYVKDNIKIPDKYGRTEVTFDIEAGEITQRIKVVRNVDGKVLMDEPMVQQKFHSAGTYTISLSNQS